VALPRYSGGGDREDLGSRTAWEKKIARSNLNQ
jgi:hypothetical protein